MMNKISKEIYKTDKFNIYSSHDDDDCGVILGYWDQEKTPEIVQGDFIYFFIIIYDIKSFLLTFIFTAFFF